MSNFAQFALKQLKVSFGVLFSDQVEVVPELSDLFIQESDVSLQFSCRQWAEYKAVRANTLRLKAENWVSDQTFTLEEHFKSDWLIQRVAQRNLS
jgi:hypothetical protein